MSKNLSKILLVVIVLMLGLWLGTNVAWASSHDVSCDIAGDTICSGADLNDGCVSPIASNPSDCSAYCSQGEVATCVSGGTWQCIIPTGSNSYGYSPSFPSSCGGLPAGTACRECARPSSCSCASQCKITSFNGSDLSPTVGSPINLSFSLSNPSSQTWTLEQISGPSSLSTKSGSGGYGSYTTSNLNAANDTYTYRLTCGSATSYISVVPEGTDLHASAVVKSGSNTIASASKTGTSGTDTDSGSANGTYQVTLSSNNIGQSGISFIDGNGAAISPADSFTRSGDGTYSITTRNNSTGQSVKAQVTITSTCDANNPDISSIQGYDTATGNYTSTVYANNSGETNRRVILYGTFASSGNTVTFGGSSLTITYQSTTQINAIMNTSTSGSFQVSNSCGSDSSSKSVQSPPSPPSAPSITVSTSASCGGKIDVDWNNVSGATSYKVYRNNSYITTVTSSSYSDSGLTPGSYYTYKVKAVNSNGESGFSNSTGDTASGSCVSPPDTPTISASTSGTCGGRIDVSWSSESGANSYRLYRDGSNNPIYSGPSTSYTDKNLSAGTSHSYRVEAVNSSGASAKSNSVSATASGSCSTPPSVPVIAAATGQCGGKIDLSWGAVSNATSYKIYRDGGATPVATTDEVNYTDSGLVNGTSYSYQVRASNSAGDSALSNSASAEASGNCSANASFTALPATLNYTVTVGNTPSAQIITLTNTGDQTLNIVPSETMDWFSLSGANASGCLLNPAGQFGDSCTISAGVTSQSVGTYNGTVTFSATNVPNVPIQQVAVNYTVNSGGGGPSGPTGQTATPICDYRIDVDWDPVADATSYEVDVFRSEAPTESIYQTTVTANEFIFDPYNLTLDDVGGSSGGETFTSGSNESWTPPAGVTSITVEAWGGGGGGAVTNQDESSSPAGGGGGGAYSRSVIAVPSGATYRYTVAVSGVTGPGDAGHLDSDSDSGDNGNAGADSWFRETAPEFVTRVRAKGGGGGVRTDALVYGGQAGTGDGSGNTGIWNDYGSSGGDVLPGTPINAEVGGGGGGGTTEDGEDRLYGGGSSQDGSGGSLSGGGGWGQRRGGGGSGNRTSYPGDGGDGGRGEIRISWSESLPPVDDDTLYIFKIRAVTPSGTSADSQTSPAVAIGTWECETSIPPTDYDLEVIQNGRGAVASSPAGIDCPNSTCVANFEEDTVVTLTASCNANPTWIFTGWGGDCANFGTAADCELTINGPKTATAQCLPDINFQEF